MACIMLHNHKTPISVFIFCAFWAFIVCSIAPQKVLAKSGSPISDVEIREKKTQCYEDIESGLRGLQCKTSIIAKENCALRCLSPACYELVYESDPLEEGEKDYTRSQEYKYCMHKSAKDMLTIVYKLLLAWSVYYLWRESERGIIEVINGREPG